MLRKKAHEIRKYTLTSIGKLGVGHIGGSLSLPEVLAVLYFDVMNIDPADPKKPDRDRFVLSKGHGGRRSTRRWRSGAILGSTGWTPSTVRTPTSRATAI